MIKSRILNAQRKEPKSAQTAGTKGSHLKRTKLMFAAFAVAGVSIASVIASAVVALAAPATSDQNFYYQSAVAYTVSPSQVSSAGGTIITIKGDGFARPSASEDQLKSDVQPVVKYGGTKSGTTVSGGTTLSDCQVFSAQTISCKLPATIAAGSYTLSVTIPAHKDASDFSNASASNTVSEYTNFITSETPLNDSVIDGADAGDTPKASALTVSAVPLGGISPNKGSQTGGQLVHIYGENFISGNVSSVTIGGQTCSSPTVLSKFELTCETPNVSAVASVKKGNVQDVVVTQDSQTYTLPAAYSFTADDTFKDNKAKSITIGASNKSNILSYNGGSFTVTLSPALSSNISTITLRDPAISSVENSAQSGDITCVVSAASSSTSAVCTFTAQDVAGIKNAGGLYNVIVGDGTSQAVFYNGVKLETRQPLSIPEVTKYGSDATDANQNESAATIPNALKPEMFFRFPLSEPNYLTDKANLKYCVVLDDVSFPGTAENDGLCNATRTDGSAAASASADYWLTASDLANASSVYNSGASTASKATQNGTSITFPITISGTTGETKLTVFVKNTLGNISAPTVLEAQPRKISYDLNINDGSSDYANGKLPREGSDTAEAPSTTNCAGRGWTQADASTRSTNCQDATVTNNRETYYDTSQYVLNGRTLSTSGDTGTTLTNSGVKDEKTNFVKVAPVLKGYNGTYNAANWKYGDGFADGACAKGEKTNTTTANTVGKTSGTCNNTLDTSTAITADVTARAAWTAINYTLTLAENGLKSGSIDYKAEKQLWGGETGHLVDFNSSPTVATALNVGDNVSLIACGVKGFGTDSQFANTGTTANSGFAITRETGTTAVSASGSSSSVSSDINCNDKLSNENNKTSSTLTMPASSITATYTWVPTEYTLTLSPSSTPAYTGNCSEASPSILSSSCDAVASGAGGIAVARKTNQLGNVTALNGSSDTFNIFDKIEVRHSDAAKSGDVFAETATGTRFANLGYIAAGWAQTALTGANSLTASAKGDSYTCGATSWTDSSFKSTISSSSTATHETADTACSFIGQTPTANSLSITPDFAFHNFAINLNIFWPYSGTLGSNASKIDDGEVVICRAKNNMTSYSSSIGSDPLAKNADNYDNITSYCRPNSGDKSNIKDAEKPTYDNIDSTAPKTVKSSIFADAHIGGKYVLLMKKTTSGVEANNVNAGGNGVESCGTWTNNDATTKCFLITMASFDNTITASFMALSYADVAAVKTDNGSGGALASFPTGLKVTATNGDHDAPAAAENAVTAPEKGMGHNVDMSGVGAFADIPDGYELKEWRIYTCSSEKPTGSGSFCAYSPTWSSPADWNGSSDGDHSINSGNLNGKTVTISSTAGKRFIYLDLAPALSLKFEAVIQGAKRQIKFQYGSDYPEKRPQNESSISNFTQAFLDALSSTASASEGSRTQSKLYIPSTTGFTQPDGYKFNGFKDSASEGKYYMGINDLIAFGIAKGTFSESTDEAECDAYMTDMDKDTDNNQAPDGSETKPYCRYDGTAGVPATGLIFNTSWRLNQYKVKVNYNAPEAASTLPTPAPTLTPTPAPSVTAGTPAPDTTITNVPYGSALYDGTATGNPQNTNYTPPSSNAYDFNGFYKQTADDNCGTTDSTPWSFTDPKTTVQSDTLLCGKWTPKKFTFTMDYSGHGTTDGSTTGEALQNQNLSVDYATDLTADTGGSGFLALNPGVKPNPEDPNYNFNGWYTDADGDGSGCDGSNTPGNGTCTNRITFGNESSNLRYMLNTPIGLHAKWEAKDVSLTFCLNDGTAHSKLGSSDTPSTDADKCKVDVKGSTSVTKVTNYPSSTAPKYGATLAATSGAGSGYLASPTRVGYDFVGWSTDAAATETNAGSGKWYLKLSGSDQVAANTVALTNDNGVDNNTLTLFAIWKPKQVTVNFMKTGATTALGSQTRQFDGLIDNFPDVPDATADSGMLGFVMCGYSTKYSSIATERVQILGVSSDNTDGSSSCSSASWGNVFEKNTTTLNMTINGGDVNKTPPIADNDGGIYSNSDALTLNLFPRLQRKSVAINWCLNDSATYSDACASTGNDGGNPATWDTNYATNRPTPVGYGSALSTATSYSGSALPAPTRKGKTFKGWYVAGETTPTSNYVAATDTATAAMKNAKGVVGAEDSTPSLTLVADWENAASGSWSISYSRNSGDTMATSSPEIPSATQCSWDSTFKDCSATIAQPNQERVGYTQTGWTATESGNADSSYAGGTSLSLDNNLTLFPAYTQKPHYTVTYHQDGATGGTTPASPQTCAWNSTDNANCQVTIANNVFTKDTDEDSFTQQGWSTAENGAVDSNYTPGGTANLTGNVNLYPVWVAKDKYALSYDANGGELGTIPASENCHYTGADRTNCWVNVTSEKPTRANFEFLGWCSVDTTDGTMKNLREDICAARNTIYDAGETLPLTGAKTIYAMWRYLGKELHLKYDGQGGTGFVADSTCFQNQAGANCTVVETRQNTFIQEGYLFSGWCDGDITDQGKDSPTCSSTVYGAGTNGVGTTSIEVPDAGKTLKAMWKRISYNLTIRKVTQNNSGQSVSGAKVLYCIATSDAGAGSCTPNTESTDAAISRLHKGDKVFFKATATGTSWQANFTWNGDGTKRDPENFGIQWGSSDQVVTAAFVPLEYSVEVHASDAKYEDKFTRGDGLKGATIDMPVQVNVTTKVGYKVTGWQCEGSICPSSWGFGSTPGLAADQGGRNYSVSFTTKHSGSVPADKLIIKPIIAPNNVHYSLYTGLTNGYPEGHLGEAVASGTNVETTVGSVIDASADLWKEPTHSEDAIAFPYVFKGWRIVEPGCQGGCTPIVPPNDKFTVPEIESDVTVVLQAVWERSSFVTVTFKAVEADGTVIVASKFTPEGNVQKQQHLLGGRILTSPTFTLTSGEHHLTDLGWFDGPSAGSKRLNTIPADQFDNRPFNPPVPVPNNMSVYRVYNHPKCSSDQTIYAEDPKCDAKPVPGPTPSGSPTVSPTPKPGGKPGEVECPAGYGLQADGQCVWGEYPAHEPPNPAPTQGPDGMMSCPAGYEYDGINSCQKKPNPAPTPGPDGKLQCPAGYTLTEDGRCLPNWAPKPTPRPEPLPPAPNGSGQVNIEIDIVIDGQTVHTWNPGATKNPLSDANGVYAILFAGQQAWAKIEAAPETFSHSGDVEAVAAELQSLSFEVSKSLMRDCSTKNPENNPQHSGSANSDGSLCVFIPLDTRQQDTIYGGSNILHSSAQGTPHKVVLQGSIADGQGKNQTLSGPFFVRDMPAVDPYGKCTISKSGGLEIQSEEVCNAVQGSWIAKGAAPGPGPNPGPTHNGGNNNGGGDNPINEDYCRAIGQFYWSDGFCHETEPTGEMIPDAAPDVIGGRNNGLVKTGIAIGLTLIFFIFAFWSAVTLRRKMGWASVHFDSNVGFSGLLDQAKSFASDVRRRLKWKSIH